ncbi:hypothetical protein [Calothrix sp. NIES-2098]|uniref:hypothetical protein n=1 Tax=Calothrix sp. NIES-2098 TaxID=1954171 RepID=UPI000B5E9D68|nr:hypothetical protein NIES2098_06170 [Calothrix sp. NIES-2098]
MSDWSEQKKELKIQQGIRQAEDDLVIAIQKALDNSKYGELEESQFRNLVRVSDTTESTEVIKNFIRYQVGRDEKWGKGKESLAEQIIQDIDNLINNLSKKIAQEAKSENLNHILLELTRRYLGYGSRYLVYKRKGQS